MLIFFTGFSKPGKEFGLILRVLRWLRVFLVPDLGSGGGFVILADGKLRDPEASVVTNFPKLGLSTVDQLEPGFLSNARNGSDFGYKEFLGHMTGHDISVTLR